MKQEHTFHSGVGNAHKATSVGALPGVNIKRKANIPTATATSIERSIIRTWVEVRAKVVVVATQQRA
jgi:hypothetical protein